MSKGIEEGLFKKYEVIQFDRNVCLGKGNSKRKEKNRFGGKLIIVFKYLIKKLRESLQIG